MFKNIRFYLVYSDSQEDTENISVVTWTDPKMQTQNTFQNSNMECCDTIFFENSHLFEYSRSYCLGNRSIILSNIAIAASMVGNQNFEC